MRSDTAWLKESKWGVILHFLADYASCGKKTDITPAEWNRKVDGFDTAGLAEQLMSAGAGYIMLTIGQNSGFFCAPNRVYDEIIGAPGRCSKRDLISDLYDELEPRGVKLMVYISSGAPANDPAAVEKFEWRWGFRLPPHSFPPFYPNHDRTAETGAEPGGSDFCGPARRRRDRAFRRISANGARRGGPRLQRHAVLQPGLLQRRPGSRRGDAEVSE